MSDRREALRLAVLLDTTGLVPECQECRAPGVEGLLLLHSRGPSTPHTCNKPTAIDWPTFTPPHEPAFPPPVTAGTKPFLVHLGTPERGRAA